jgi:hypothetical protein
VTPAERISTRRGTSSDTAPLRYRYYHSDSDTPEKLNFEWLNRAVSDLKIVVADLVGSN